MEPCINYEQFQNGKKNEALELQNQVEEKAKIAQQKLNEQEKVKMLNQLSVDELDMTEDN